MNVPTTLPGIGSVPNLPNGSFSQSGGVTVTNSGLGLAPIGAILAYVLIVGVVLAVVGIFVIVVVANRADPDPTGRRPQSVYYFAVSFVTIAIAIIGSAVVVYGLVRLIGGHAGSITNSVAKTVVLGGLITLVGLVLLFTHLRSGLALARADAGTPSPSRRVGQSYVAAVAFVAILVLLVVTVFAAYLIFALAGPGVFGSFGGRTATTRYLIESAYLGVIAVVVLYTHRNLVAPGLTLIGRGGAAEVTALGPAHAPNGPPT